jgi:hypothetical protein
MENNINAINLSNLKETNLLNLEKIIIELNKLKNKNINLNNNNKQIYKYFYDEIRKKFIEFSYQIYLKAYTCKKEKESELVNLQNQVLEIYKLYFENPSKINYYLNSMQVILFLRFIKKPIIKNNKLYWENSNNQLNNNSFIQKYEHNIKEFKEILYNEFYNNLQYDDYFKNKNVDLIKKESNMLSTLSKIHYDYKLNDRYPDSQKIIKKFHIKFLENIYKEAKNKKDVNFLSYLEIYNNVLAEFGIYFGYPNNENSKNNILLKNLEELFKILKNLELNKKQSINSEKNYKNKRENINKGVKSTMNLLVGKVKNRVSEKIKEVNNYSSTNKNINNHNSLSELKQNAENILKLYKNSNDQEKSKKLYSLFKKTIDKIKTIILPRVYKNINNIEKMEKEINVESFVY